MPKFEVFTLCPTHKKPVSLIVSAANPSEAEEKAVGKTVACPYYPTHTFVVGFREGKTEILGVRPLPLMPVTAELLPGKAPYLEAPAVSIGAPERRATEAELERLGRLGRAPAYVPSPPLEKIYYIDRDVAEKIRRRSQWWTE
jgi:hypothetical protein